MSVAALTAQPLAALPPYGCGVPLAGSERHVIHAALQDYPEVTTFSTGSEPHRRIVVAYAKEK